MTILIAITLSDIMSTEYGTIFKAPVAQIIVSAGGIEIHFKCGAVAEKEQV